MSSEADGSGKVRVKRAKLRALFAKVKEESGKVDLRPKLLYSAAAYEVLALGLAIGSGGQCFGWNRGLELGFWPFVGATLVVGLGYLSVASCVAEMVSTMQITGGSFGYIRCAAGPIWGFLASTQDLLHSFFLIVAFVVAIGAEIADLTLTAQEYQPLLALAFYLVGLPVLIVDGSPMWKTIAVTSISATIVVALYCLSTASHANLLRYSTYAPAVGGVEFMCLLPSTAWLFQGSGVSVTVAAPNLDQPAQLLPKVAVAGIVLQAGVSICILLSAGAIAPGPATIASVFSPLSVGLQDALHLTRSLGALLMLPAAMTAALASLFCCSRRLHALAHAGLISPVLNRTVGGHQTPLMAILATALLSYTAMLGVHFSSRHARDGLQLAFGIGMLGSCCVNVLVCATFVVMRAHYASMARPWRSLLGVAGAWGGMMCFVCIALGLAFFQTHFRCFTVWILATSGSLVYYFVYAQYVQSFTQEEQGRFSRTISSHLRSQRMHRTLLRKLWSRMVATRRVPRVVPTYSAAGSEEDESGGTGGSVPIVRKQRDTHDLSLAQFPTSWSVEPLTEPLSAVPRRRDEGAV